MKKYISTILIVLFASSCNKQTTEPSKDTFVVQGNLVDGKGAIANATISIDSTINWTTQSDQNGNFKINGVSKGNHTLTYNKTYGDSTYVVRSNNLQVYDDVTLNSLKLPIPIAVNYPSNIGVTSLTINWNSTDAEDFREYKLYRQITPGLDETTGELIYVGTNRKDTVFNDNNLASGKTYYYRIYIMNDFGKLGGSNIVSTATIKGNLISDGDFENRQDIYSFWGINYGSANFIFTDSLKKSGNYSLQGKLTSVDVSLNSKNLFKLAGGITYELSGWFKAYGKTLGTHEVISLGLTDGPNYNYVQSIYVWATGPLSEPVTIEWTYVTKTFTPVNDVTVYLNLHCGIENFWYDDLKLIAK